MPARGLPVAQPMLRRYAMALEARCPAASGRRGDGTLVCRREGTSRGCESLRCALIARGPARDGLDPSRHRELWSALIAGSWTLLDVFNAAGTRYVLARETKSAAPHRTLSAREQSVLELTLAGRSGKWIALELDLSEPAVARTLSAALRRIGAASIAALAGVRTARFELLDDLRRRPLLALARLTLPVPATPLTDSEQAVMACVWDGKPVAAIARQRGTSPRTVGHQLLSAYRKLRISSRRELFSLLTGTRC